MVNDTVTARLVQPVGERDHVQGPADAPVTVIEYADYACPSAAVAYPIIKALKAELGDRMRLVFRAFPLVGMHPFAQRAAEAAEAAAAQGEFWAMHNKLFEHQRALTDEDLTQYASEIGLDVARFRSDLNQHLYAEAVRQVYRHARQAGVDQSPTFFVGGYVYTDWDDMEWRARRTARLARESGNQSATGDGGSTRGQGHL